MREFVVETGDSSFRIELEKLEADGAGQEYLVDLDGRREKLSVVALTPSRLSLLIGNLSREAEVVREGELYRVVVRGKEYVFRVRDADEAESLPETAESTEAVITAPMSGLVVEVFVEPGCGIEPETKLLVLEAMKMQNEITSPRPGRVVEVSVRPGDSVKLGDQLVVIE